MGQEMKTIWQLDFDEARRLKRKVEGEPPVDGLDCGEPSTRLYLQMLEAANDLDQIERDGKPVPAFLRQAFRSAALWARSIAQDDRPRPWEER